MEVRSIARRVMAAKPSMKRRRAEDDDKNASNCQSWKKRMMKKNAEDDDETWKKMGENIKLLEARIKNVTNKKHQDFESCNGGKEHSTSPETIMSREKALRAAMLKTRFADTIHRATQMLFPDRKFDHPKIQQEKDLKMRRERERKALEEMEKRVEVDNTVATLKTWFGPTWNGI